MIALALMLAQASSPAKRPAQQIAIFGVGGYSCERAWMPENQSFSRNWVLGYWTAENDAFGLSVGEHSDAEGFWGEVQRVCRSQPGTPLYMATASAYVAMKRRGL